MTEKKTENMDARAPALPCLSSYTDGYGLIHRCVLKYEHAPGRVCNYGPGERHDPVPVDRHFYHANCVCCTEVDRLSHKVAVLRAELAAVRNVVEEEGKISDAFEDAWGDEKARADAAAVEIAKLRNELDVIQQQAKSIWQSQSKVVGKGWRKFAGHIMETARAALALKEGK